MRRVEDSPPEVRALVADRLQFVLGGPQGRRVAPQPPEGPGPAARESPEDRLDTPAEPGRFVLPGFARVHVAVVTVLVLVGLLGAGWALFRARPVAVAAPGVAVSTVPGAPAGGGPPASAPASASAPVEIVVHVVGAVRRPGLVRLVEGARVQDAVDAAGGLTRDARPGRLNLAQVLGDGQQVVIGRGRDPVSEVRDGSAPPGTSAGPRASASTLDLNRASATELEQLPGVGPVTAAAIVGWRTQHGRFSAVAELQQVDGIGPKTYAQIAPHVRV